MSCALAAAVEKGLQIDYDMMNRNWQVVKPSGATFTKSYDPNGNVSTETDGENNTTAYTYNSKGWCTQTTDAAANNFDKTYDAMGRVATETVSPDGGQTLYTTSYTRDALGNPTAITDPLNNTHLNFFDTAGRLDYYIDRNGNTVGFGYNNMGSISHVNHPAPLNPGSGMSTTIDYDKKGRVTHYDSPDVQRWYQYDSLDRVTTEEQYMPAWPSFGTMYSQFTYDAKNRNKSVRDFQGVDTSYAYDDINRAKEIVEGVRSHYINYDASGRVVKKTLSTGMSEEYTYDSASRLVGTETRNSQNTLVASETYSYDYNDRVLTETATGYNGNYSREFGYDSRGNLTNETRYTWQPISNSYTYDGMGCRTQKDIGGNVTNYSYNGLGRITSANGTNYSYDANGNLIGRGTETFTYDWKNNMVRYQDSSSNKDYYLGYDIGNTLVAKGWTTQIQQSSGIDGARGMRGVQAVFSDRKTAVRIATATRSIDCFADLGNNEEEFFLKSYNTSSMYNLMYEDASAQSFTMLRHWTESGDEFNKYIQEFNYDAFDPTGLALGLHFTHENLVGNYPYTTDIFQTLTTQTVLDAFLVNDWSPNPRTELWGKDDHRVVSINSSFTASDFYFATDCMFASILGPRSTELDSTATTLSSWVVRSPISVNTANLFTFSWDPIHWRFRTKFHIEFSWSVETHREKEKYIDIPTTPSTPGSELGWRTYLNATSFGAMRNIEALRASYGQNAFTSNGCASYACAFMLNYQSLMNGSGLTITPNERHIFHTFRCGYNASGNINGRSPDDSGYLYAMDHSVGNSTMTVGTSTYKLDFNAKSEADRNWQDRQLARIARSISNNSPVYMGGRRYYSMFPAFSGHAEVEIGHRYIETQTDKHLVVIDSDTGYSHTIDTKFTTDKYSAITLLNLNNDILFRWRTMYDSAMKNNDNKGFTDVNWDPISRADVSTPVSYMTLP